MAIAVDNTLIGSVAVDSALGTIAFTTTVTVAASGFIVLAAAWFGTTTLSSVAGGGLTWTIDKQGIVGVDKSQAIISAQAPSGLASSTTITATLSGSSPGGRSMAGISFTGVATSAPVDGTPAAPAGSSGTAWATPSASLTAGSVLVGAAYEVDTDRSSTAAAGSTEFFDLNGGVGTFAHTGGYRIEASAASYTVAGTWATGSVVWSGLGVAYLAAAGGGGAGATQNLVMPPMR